MSSQDIPKLRIGKLSKFIEDEINELVEWMGTRNKSGSILELSYGWSEYTGVRKKGGKLDHKFYRRMSNLLRIAHEKGMVEFEWMESKSPIPQKVYRVLPKPSKKHPENNTSQETNLTRGYKVDSMMILDLKGFRIHENRREGLYSGLY
jgi:hypothetical protein